MDLTKQPTVERRHSSTYGLNDRVEVRTDEATGKKVVRGWAAVYNSWSNDLGGFVERIAPGFFDKVLSASMDVRALFNHDPNYVLARTVSGTLRIGTDAKGLWYEYDDPDTTFSRDLLTLMQRGDISQSSFAFSLADNGDKWEKQNGQWTRTLLEASGLYDVSPVTYPAYEDTTVAMRSMQTAEKVNPEEQRKLMEEALADLFEAEQDLMKLQLQ